MSLRRLLPAVAALLLAAPLARAEAQAACVAGTLQSYIDAGECLFGDLLFSRFRFSLYPGGTADGVAKTFPSADLILVTPTATPGTGGTTDVSLVFTGFAASMTATQPSLPDSSVFMFATTRFDVERTLPGTTFAATSAAFSAVLSPAHDDPDAATPRPSVRVFTEGGYDPVIDDYVDCLAGTFYPSIPGAQVESAACPPRVTRLEVGATLEIRAGGTGNPPMRVTPGSASVSLDRLTFTTAFTPVPEPGSLALLVPGLLGVAAAYRRRRMADTRRGA